MRQKRDGAGLKVDLAALRELNPDTAAWLYCPGTPINYPVMMAENNDKYLRGLPDGSYSLYGSLFIDYNCAADFGGKLTVIYGHNIKNEAMFGTLPLYGQQSYYEEHPDIYLYTQETNYTIQLLYGAKISAKEWEQNGFLEEENLDSLLQYAAQHTSFQSAVQRREDARYVALMTCDYDYDEARYFLLGVLNPDEESE
ncbi:MAG: class B sortase [Oscillospiraceae bacterium]|nr:class B sortase [Oscillospiraceae bacterium]